MRRAAVVVGVAACVALALPGAAVTSANEPVRVEAASSLSTDLVCNTLRLESVEASLKRFVQRLAGGPRTVAGKLVGGLLGASLTFCEDLLPKAKRVANLGVARLIGSSAPSPNSAPIVIAPGQRIRGDLVIPADGYIPVAVYWGSFDLDGVRRHDLEADVNGTVQQVAVTRDKGATYRLRPGNNFQFMVRAQDTRGVWSSFAYGPRFGLSLIADQDAGRSSNWTFHPQSDAIGGRDLFSSTSGAWTEHRFYGDYVAWIAPRWPSGGKANVYIDGRKLQTVDLYSTSPQHRLVLSAWQWPTKGTHTITVELVRGAIESDGFIVLS